MAEFERKTNYSKKTLNSIKEIQQWNKGKEASDKILVVPQKDCFKAYFHGITLIEKLTDNTLKLANVNDDFKKEVKSVTDLLRTLEKNMGVFAGKMPRDRERRSSQIISLNNMNFAENSYSVCGWEWTISRNDVRIKEKKGGPEIDIVFFNPKEMTIILCEYKCKGDTLLEGNQNIVNHYRDYHAVLNAPCIDDIILKTIEVYKMMYELANEKSIDIDCTKIKKRIGFLFVDKVKYNENESVISENDYNIAYEMIKDWDYLDNLYYIRAKTDNNVVIKDWKPVKGSKFKLTN